MGCYPLPVPRLLVVGPSWPLRGGIARTTTLLAQALAEAGSLAGFLTPERQYPRRLYPGASDVDPDACPRLPQARRCFGVLEPWTWRKAVGEGRIVSADALVLPYWTWVWAPFERSLARRLGLPVVAVVHNPADHDASRLARLSAAWVLGRADAYFCHARAVERQVLGRFPGRPTAVHPLPADAPPRADRAAARARLGVADGSVAILCFGLIRPYKGVDVLLEAFASLPRELPMTLLLAGEPWGDKGISLAERLARPDLAGRVRARLEWVPEQEAGEWFAAADAAVLPYLAATGSAVAAQALGAGLPVVGTLVGGIAEVVEEGRNGLLVPPADPAALAGALRRLTAPGVLARLATGAAAVAARWTWRSYAEALSGLAGALGHSPAGRPDLPAGYTGAKSGDSECSH